MKKSRVFLGSLIVTGMLAASAVSAQPHDDHGRGNHGKGDQDHGRGHGPEHMPPGHGPDGPGASAYAPGHWRKGDRLPPEYRDRQYVIDDWRAYRLAPPPRGYYWLGVGGDYLLVQISSGIVLRVGP
ncbi:RcnB family protein [Paraburkholderia kururiensis]|uniref:RcnB family protein n=1 Tax=Paraburkholderia kururiensis TaxID=984307 RepID=A0ABZ0WHQ3_9BURK|nr:RcnB family protein [Paraburkholderia kururiensis]WQD76840.1 RcnB family protein [Paraburkholderia kururiensis]